MAKNKKINIVSMTRAAIQLIFFIAAPELFQASFTGIKYIAGQMHEGNVIEITSFVLCLLVLCGFTIVFGRFFCGFACAFGSFGDAVYAISQFIQKKTKKKMPKIPEKYSVHLQKVKYVVLMAIVIMCFLGVYNEFAKNSPWTVFSKLQALEFKQTFSVIGIILLILIVVGMSIEERFFCQFFCPMGAFFALLPVIPFSQPKKQKEMCIKGCSLCQRRCPAHIDTEDKKNYYECINCYKCVSGCPKSSMHIAADFGINSAVAAVIKGILLMGIVYLWLK